MKDDIFLEEAVQRYKGFLHLIRRNVEKKSNNFCVPTYDIDLIWHTHQLHPLSYYNDTVSLLGNILDHDDNDSDRTKGQKLDVGFTTTTKQWAQMFPSRYWRAGAMYTNMTPSNNLDNLAQSFEVMFVEVCFSKLSQFRKSFWNKYRLVSQGWNYKVLQMIAPFVHKEQKNSQNSNRSVD